MKTLTKKQAILQSLEAMSSTDMEKVLSYIKEQLQDSGHGRNYQNIKQKAMKEIRKALRKTDGIHLAV